MSYIYVKSEPGLFTVGCYGPNGQWNPDSDHDNREQAADRCCYLNGGRPKALDAAHAAMRQALLDEDPMTVIRMALEKAGVET